MHPSAWQGIKPVALSILTNLTITTINKDGNNLTAKQDFLHRANQTKSIKTIITSGVSVQGTRGYASACRGSRQIQITNFSIGILYNSWRFSQFCNMICPTADYDGR